MASTNRVSKALGEKFSFSIQNISGATRVIALLAAFFDTLIVSMSQTGGEWVATPSFNNAENLVSAGYPCDCVLDDGMPIGGVFCTSMASKRSIRQFREYIKCNPRILQDMTIQATIPAQFNETLEVIKYTPLLSPLSQELPLNDFKSVDQISTDKVNINGISLEMAYDTLLLLPVPNGCTTTISFRFS